MSVMLSQPETQILTVSQPAPQPPVRIISPAADELMEYAIQVHDYCVDHAMPVPQAVRDMYPCLYDALDHGDDVYIGIIHDFFYIVAQDAVYGQPVWKQRRIE